MGGAGYIGLQYQFQHNNKNHSIRICSGNTWLHRDTSIWGIKKVAGYNICLVCYNKMVVHQGTNNNKQMCLLTNLTAPIIPIFKASNR